MTTTARGLGFEFDIIPAVIPVDLEAGLKHGFAVNMKNYEKVAIVVFAGIGTANDDLQIDVQQSKSGALANAKDLDIVTSYYVKDALVLTAAQTWAKVTQAAASEITDAGGAGTSAEHSQILVVEIRADQMDIANGFHWLSVDIPDLGAAGAKIGCAFYIATGLHSQRAPENLTNPNA